MALSACGRIGFDPTSGIDSGTVPSVFTEVVLPDGASVTELTRGTDGTLYAVLGNVRVVRSSNLGASWIDCGVIQGGIENVAVDPSSGTVYVAGPPGLLRSVDACATWSSTGLAAYSYYVTVFEGQAYAGTDDGLWVLDTSWTRVATPMDGHHIFEVDGDEPGGRLFLCGDNGLARSIDQGVTWTLETAGLPANGGTQFAAVDLANDQRVMVSAGSVTGYKDFTSTDGGVTWNTLNRGGFTVAYDPSDPLFAVFGSYDFGINVSTDGGVSFGAPRFDSAAMQRSATLPLVFVGCSGLYAGTGRGVFYAPDHTLAWSELDTGLHGWTIHQIAVSPSGTIYLGTDAGVLSSTDDGATWSENSNGILGVSQVNAVIPIPGTGDSIFAGAINDLSRSDDAGQTFNQLYQLSLADLYTLNALSASGSKLIVGAAGGVVIADAPWTTYTSVQLGGQPHNVPAVLAVDPMHLLAGSDGGLFYSTDGGMSFNDVSSGLTDPSVTAITQLADGSLLVGTETAGIFRASSPNGPWSPSGLAGQYIGALLVTGSKTITATDHGVFASGDNGVSWQELPGLATLDPQTLAIGPAGDLLVGTAGFGLYRTPMP